MHDERHGHEARGSSWSRGTRRGLRRGARPVMAVALMLAAAILAAPEAPTAARADVAAPAAVHFEPNRGQAPDEAAFVARGPGFGLHVRADGLSLALLDAEGEQGTVIRMAILGATGRTPRALEATGGQSHYLRGSDETAWVRGVPHYRRVRVPEVLPGIDVVYYGREGRLEYDFVVRPGADPSAIRLAFEGAEGMRIDEQGDLVLETAHGDVVQRAPVAFQEIDGRRTVEAAFRLGEDGAVAFELGDYDRRHELVIDPILVYGTYVGGDPVGSQRTEALAVDANGDAYLAGMTTALDFPVTSGAYQTTHAGVYFDAFVVRIAANGVVLYATYLGGSDDGFPEGQGGDHATGIATDGLGRAYVVGWTGSLDFPVTSDAIQATHAGSSDAFLAILSADGASLEYSTFLGGMEQDGATGVRRDGTGRIVVVGTTFSPDFPTVNAALANHQGNMDSFVAVLQADRSALAFSTYLGGSASDWVRTAPAVDAQDNIVVAGITRSADLVTTAGAYQRASAGWYGNDDYRSRDGFVQKYGPTGNLLLSTYFGGSEQDLASAVALDVSGDIYITGETRSSNLPVTTGAYQTRKTRNTEPGIYVAKLSANGSALLYGTYIDPPGDDRSISLVVDGGKRAHVLGHTASRKWPAVNAFQASRGGSYDACLAVLDPTGSRLELSSYFGGSDYEEGREIALGPNGLIYLCGRTDSADLPVSSDAWIGVDPGGDQGFFAILDPAGGGGGDDGGSGGPGGGKGNGKGPNK